MAIKKNASLNLKEINAGLNKFNKHDLRTLFASIDESDGQEILDKDKNTDSEGSTHKSSFEAASSQFAESMSIIDILSAPENSQGGDFFTQELGQCLKLY